jgi:two-component system, OmpR family, sensor histidine kinase KdpD
LRFLADDTDEELLEHLRQHQPQAQWETSERIMVAVTTGPGTDVLMRRAARMALRIKGPLDVVHVAAEDTATAGDDRSLGKLRDLAGKLGARWYEIRDDNPARAIASFAREIRSRRS